VIQAVLVAAEGGEQPSILFPAIYDIIWGGLSFVIVLLLFWRFVLPRVRQVTQARTERIEGGIENAEKMQDEAQRLLVDYRNQMTESRTEAAKIRTQAEADRSAIIEEARKDAQQVAANVNAQSVAALEAERSKIVAELQDEVAMLALDLAEKIVGATLSEDARAKAVIDKFMSDLEINSAKEVSR
jgi:F-type H+-transporting ATPase subunit b